MNCPSRTDETDEREGWNQSPPALAADLTTRSDLNGIVNLRMQRDHLPPGEPSLEELPDDEIIELGESSTKGIAVTIPINAIHKVEKSPRNQSQLFPDGAQDRQSSSQHRDSASLFRRVGQVLLKFSKFIGPGFMVSVAYIDPGNYSTNVAAGASDRFRLLFVVLLANLFAIILQALSVRLGTITGLNLAEHCRLHLPKWLNLVLYVLAEAAIIATDIAEVIGSAIALNLLLKIPLVAGCALTLVDVLLILSFYDPSGSMRRLRIFEFCIVGLVFAVVVCFCIQLSLITSTSVGEVFLGYLPSSAVVDGHGLYLSCGILGATVMPHSLYLGSGMVQARLRAFDTKAELHALNSDISFPPCNVTATDNVLDVSMNNQMATEQTEQQSNKDYYYHPSLAAIRSCLSYSMAELALSLCIVALFVNSAILIVAGASLSNNPDASTADLFGIHNLLSSTIAPAAGTIFALALLLSGTSAGIVCTIAGQMVSEGAIQWRLAPWLRRLITRSISITPSIIIAAGVGQQGLSAALNASQVALSVILPFVSAPLIYFTCRNKYMTVGSKEAENQDGANRIDEGVKMRNHWVMSVVAVGVWLTVTVMNIALLVFLGLGKA